MKKNETNHRTYCESNMDVLLLGAIGNGTDVSPKTDQILQIMVYHCGYPSQFPACEDLRSPEAMVVAKAHVFHAYSFVGVSLGGGQLHDRRRVTCPASRVRLVPTTLSSSSSSSSTRPHPCTQVLERPEDSHAALAAVFPELFGNDAATQRLMNATRENRSGKPANDFVVSVSGLGGGGGSTNDIVVLCGWGGGGSTNDTVTSVRLGAGLGLVLWQATDEPALL